MILALSFILIARFAYIQIVNGSIYSRSAVDQRVRRVYLSDYRGTIYDRNMIPITERKSTQYAVVFPDLIKDKNKAISYLTRITGCDVLTLKKLLNGTAFTLAIENSNIKTQQNGIYIATVSERYSDKAIASHIIGYLNLYSHSGVYGIEKAYDNVLNSGGQIQYTIFLDGNLQAIKGLGSQYTITGVKRRSYGIKTTIDYHIQKIAEDVMDEHHINGAVVILDVKTGQILAMASRPNFVPSKISEYLSNSDGALVNKALTAYPLGSVFKTVVAAAALENNVITEKQTFYCTGNVKIDGISYPCYKNKAHGPVDMDKAFALSCNTTFIKIGERVGSSRIIDMAEKFGFGNKVINFSEENTGHIPQPKEVAGAGIGNLSIGQGTLTVTPLQVADMMATIANNGIRHIPIIVQGIVDDNGNLIRKENVNRSYRVISASTAKKLQQMLRDVVTDGTGIRADIREGSAGKTGTAETGKTGISHGWFAGYAPYSDPRYAVVVFAENGGEGGVRAAPVFKDIVENILKIK
ncbi:penicillin-binding protein 2 [Caldanaerobius fijiensis DSM 17918]|uniref:Penicillin-binding protein 2 n=2 Tax=Caldanaerobius TaxID=862261 RepID=A0A1M4U295_9THEO|nr:penicillin-binding protein 2 [Caldanaerobius fijiensis DSM 17918]